MKFYRDKETENEFIKIQDYHLDSKQGNYLEIRTNTIFTLRNDLMKEITFHEAFRNDVNKIVLEADKNYFTEYVKLEDAHKTLISEYKDLQDRATLYVRDINSAKKEIMELTQKSIDDQRVNDQRFCDLYDSKKSISDKFQEATAYIGELKKFIQHLQDYIAAKHLEENGLILEKFIQEESDNGSRKESYSKKETSIKEKAI